ncbi:MAG: hypothetical protein ISS78_05630 [Phycisphaerae bacterium]|nr:hypothetical protein [Phycisphaerae bacterium]
MARTMVVGVLLISALAVMGGCFDATTELYVTKNGSGTITSTVYLSQTMMTMLGDMDAAMGGMGGPKKEGVPDKAATKPAKKGPLAQMMDKEKLAKKAAEMGEGVTFKSVKELKHKDGRMGVQAVYEFKDVTKVKLSMEMDQPKKGRMGGAPKGPGAGEGEAAKKKDRPTRFEFQKGPTPKLTILMPEMKKPEGGAEAGKATTKPAGRKPGGKTPEEEAAAKQMMKMMFKDLRFSIRVKVEGKITKTNAVHVNEARNGLTLLMMDLGGILGDEKLAKELEALEGVKDMNMLKAKLNKPELKKFVQVELGPKVEVEFR